MTASLPNGLLNFPNAMPMLPPAQSTFPNNRANTGEIGQGFEHLFLQLNLGNLPNTGHHHHHYWPLTNTHTTHAVTPSSPTAVDSSKQILNNCYS